MLSSSYHLLGEAISLNNISKSYWQADKEIQGLKDINCEVDEGEIVSITGPSGSGKTTLLNIIALIDSLDLGELNIFGEDLSNKSDKEKSKFRKNKNLKSRVHFTFCNKHF